MGYLFVDDDFVETKVLKRHFKNSTRLHLFYANSYSEANEIILNNSIDIIFSDYNLGDGDGYQFHKDFPDKKLYILSGSGIPGDLVDEFTKKGIEIIDKDFNKEYLDRIDEILGVAH